jgi:DNA-binding protein Fis
MTEEKIKQESASLERESDTQEKVILEKLKHSIRYYKLLLSRAKTKENKKVYKMVLHELERCLFDQ